MEYESRNHHDGDVYKGNYKEDERHGYGEMYWKDGQLYKGDWKEGKQRGCIEVRKSI